MQEYRCLTINFSTPTLPSLCNFVHILKFIIFIVYFLFGVTMCFFSAVSTTIHSTQNQSNITVVTLVLFLVCYMFRSVIWIIIRRFLKHFHFYRIVYAVA
jgi:hypothetical protein